MKERLNWVDALRGFTMVSVVLVHVLTYSFQVNPTQSVLCILRGTFTLPLFFFVSGYFLYRPIADWTGKKTASALKVRTVALVGGTIVFSTIFFFGSPKHQPFDWVSNGDFGQYWYTFSLYQIFIYYLAMVRIAKAIRFEGLVRVLVGLMAVASFAHSTLYHGEYWCYWWMNEKTLLYFPYFAMGLGARRFSGQFYAVMDKPLTLSVLIVAFGLSLAAGWGAEKELKQFCEPLLMIDRLILAKFLGALLIIKIFYMYKESFDSESRFIRGWRFIGKRTLDIYFIHYFLLPYLPYVGLYMKQRNTIMTELAGGLFVAALVLAATMGVSAILRRAPGIRNLLGAKGALKVSAQRN